MALHGGPSTAEWAKWGPLLIPQARAVASLGAAGAAVDNPKASPQKTRTEYL